MAAALAPAPAAGAGAGLVYRVDDPQWLAIAAGARALEYFEQAVGPKVVAVVKAAHPADWLHQCKKAVGGSMATFVTEAGGWDTYTLVKVIYHFLPLFFQVGLFASQGRNEHRRAKQKIGKLCNSEI